MPHVTEPVPVFLTIMAVILITPLLSERVRLPRIVGLMVGGILIGPHVLGLLHVNETIELLATVGLIYLMFNAGLEIDLHQFRQVRNRSLVFGALTFAVPQIVGTLVGRAVGMAWDSALLLGSVFASHTLISYPILSQLRVVGNETVAVTIGATVFTDVGSLLVLAVLSGSHGGDASALLIARLVLMMLAYAALILIALPRLGKFFFQRFQGRAIELQFVLVALFGAALLAEVIGMHAIVGAFLAGLAINSALPPRSAVIHQTVFVGESLFVPMFLVYIGMIADPVSIFIDARSMLMGVLLTATVYIVKFLAAWITARIYHYGKAETMTMWGLSQAQAAATLAAVLVGVEIGMFDQAVFNGTLMMIICTCITSPLIVQRYAPHLAVAEMTAPKRPLFGRILLAVANPELQHLVQLAEILAATANGLLMPLHVAEDVGGRVLGLQEQQRLLNDIDKLLADSQAVIQPVRRIDATAAKGILHTAIEREASLIVMGWRGKRTVRQTVLGAVLDEVFWKATVPVLVGRLTEPIEAMRRIVLIVSPHNPRAGLAPVTIESCLAMARAANLPLHVLAAPQYVTRLETQLRHLGAEDAAEITPFEGDTVSSVIRLIDASDLVVIPTRGAQSRFRPNLGYLPERLAASTTASLAVIHYP